MQNIVPVKEIKKVWYSEKVYKLDLNHTILLNTQYTISVLIKNLSNYLSVYLPSYLSIYLNSIHIFIYSSIYLKVCYSEIVYKINMNMN